MNPAATLIRGASRLRGERVIHARGLTLHGRVEIFGGLGLGAPLLDRPASYDALLRFSRGAGLPPQLPDFLGLAVRLLDAGGPGEHQDLVMDTGAEAPVLRHLPLPRYRWLRTLYSSLLPYDVNGTSMLIGARPLGGHDVTDLAELPTVLDQVRLQLVVGRSRGAWTPFGEVTATGVVPAPHGRLVRFDPWTTGGGLCPTGWLNQLRRGAYPASHVGPDSEQGALPSERA